MKKALVVTIASLLAVTGTAAPVAATGTTAKKYANCDALLKAYPNGVAKSPKARRTAVREGFVKPEVSKSLYKANGARLDRDKDGVMCEQSGSQSSSSVSAQDSRSEGIVNCKFNGKKLQGRVFFTNNKSEADAVIFEESDSLGADLKVWFTNMLIWPECGDWLRENNRFAADLIVYVTDSRSESDFTFVQVYHPSQAGETWL